MASSEDRSMFKALVGLKWNESLQIEQGFAT
jgi:hypothetical protein